MRTTPAMICLLLLAWAGCNRPASEVTVASPVSIPGTGEQLLTLRLPGMT